MLLDNLTKYKYCFKAAAEAKQTSAGRFSQGAGGSPRELADLRERRVMEAVFRGLGDAPGIRAPIRTHQRFFEVAAAAATWSVWRFLVF